MRLLAHCEGYTIGLPDCPLAELYSKLPCQNVRLGTRVNELRFDGDRVTGVELAGGEVLTADVVILATNFHAVMRWVPPEIARNDSRFAQLEKIQTTPILGAASLV